MTKTTKEYRKAFDRKLRKLQREEVRSGGHKFDDSCICNRCSYIFKEMILFSLNWKHSKKRVFKNDKS